MEGGLHGPISKHHHNSARWTHVTGLCIHQNEVPKATAAQAAMGRAGGRLVGSGESDEAKQDARLDGYRGRHELVC